MCISFQGGQIGEEGSSIGSKVPANMQTATRFGGKCGDFYGDGHLEQGNWGGHIEKKQKLMQLQNSHFLKTQPLF